MKYLSSLLVFAATCLAQTFQVSYDTKYDDGSTSLATVACSDGTNGLLTKGFTTFGSLPKFPYIGGSFAIAGYNSPDCGTCWELTYNNGAGVVKSINVLAIDVAKPGFNIGLVAMNNLTGGQAVHLGRVQATVKQVNASICGLK
ncbi:cerato-platanin-related secreted protein [Laccaria bicolor S238N-H82]|uniref:Cerato-platanin-related secreted protein n=1 Tax=Laccaria bicolor (strain S238N-H82 / ATCC MYA-4686) TaxID=486041 RepID=B0D2X1_LACBS|nr:cerato-platanin-related secreted protein [Laccaria bicolor S238N-H82]EDR11168.1 cerato-platanin-related secreted protein [Laccaria bicolor S238N-H82]|eukprot:XP_001878469.1 cerato-platanin-related secreted protein [Laccaria bicolor S238N-H82]